MADVTRLNIEDIDSMEGPGGMRFNQLRAALGVTSFGISVVEIPPNHTEYPEHDHSEEGIGGKMFEGRPDQLGQEEVYVALEGSGTLEVDGETYPLDGKQFARVGPSTRRKVTTGDEGLRLLILGGVPGQPYKG